ncbi:MAG: hypothetical protein ACR2O4_00905, partial [Hyphomicrobiaceae bacterium]
MVLAGIAMAGCAGGPVTQTLQIPPTQRPPTGEDRLAVVPGASVPVYSRLAGGLNACWLRSGQPLGKLYVLHANVAPPPTNSATMTIHLRSAKGQRGLKAFSIDLKSFGDQTRIIMT